MKKYLKAEDYNKAIGPSVFHNCLACALSLTYQVEDDAQFNLNPDWDPYLDISEAFLNFTKKEGIRVKEVSSMEELDGKYGFIVLGFFPIRINYFFYHETIPNVDFHVIRINPDGSYTNKPNRSLPARDFTSLDNIALCDYQKELKSGNYRLFVLV